MDLCSAGRFVTFVIHASYSNPGFFPQKLEWLAHRVFPRLPGADGGLPFEGPDDLLPVTRGLLCVRGRRNSLFYPLSRVRSGVAVTGLGEKGTGFTR